MRKNKLPCGWLPDDLPGRWYSDIRGCTPQFYQVCSVPLRNSINMWKCTATTVFQHIPIAIINTQFALCMDFFFFFLQEYGLGNNNECATCLVSQCGKCRNPRDEPHRMPEWGGERLCTVRKALRHNRQKLGFARKNGGLKILFINFFPSSNNYLFI